MKYYLVILYFALIFCEVKDDEITSAETIGKKIIDNLNQYREEYNLFKPMPYDSTLMKEALNEADYLRQNPDDFTEHANYDDRLDSIDNIYYTEMFAKLLIKENPATRSLNFWKDNTKYDTELKKEYTKAGAACLEYSNGWMCVLELMNVE